MIVIGVQIGITSSCAVYYDGRIEFAASEERFSNIKNDTSFPDAALHAAMTHCRLSPENIDAVILVTENMRPEQFLIGREAKFSVKDYLREQKDYYHEVFYEGKRPDYLELFSDFIDSRYADLHDALKKSGGRAPEVWNNWRSNKVCEVLGTSRDRVFIMNHEHAHAAYAFYGSPLRTEDTLVVTFDGFGDEANASVSEWKDGRINFLQKYKNFNIGRIYRYITLLLGMKPNEHEYKVMGLAPYASSYVKKESLDVFSRSYAFTSNGAIAVDPQLRDHFYYYKERLKGHRFDAIAGALQEFTEQMTRALVAHWLRCTGKTKVVLSGGVSLNIRANMEIGKLAEVGDLFVPGSGGDESLCIGGIYAFLDKSGKAADIGPLSSLYLGADSEPSDCKRAAEELARKLPVDVDIDASDQCIAQHLASGKIIGRVCGRMEFGARALGNRSILADPRSSEVIRKINSQIKSRDFWMPFTPSILDDHAHHYLVNPKGFSFPYMSIACESTAAARAQLPAALHPADFTARPQVVTSETNRSYYSLLSAFRDATGVGALLNTSLNLHGFPIARTPADAALVFENSDLDGLLLGNTLVMRKAA